MRKATFGAGCFWHVQAVFDKLNGVVSSRVGYEGGVGRGGYENVEEEGHVEVVEIEFDPKKISYGELLDVFWEEHDPTSLNRQGADVGKRYRSVIFYHDAKQKDEAMKSSVKISKEIGKKIVTEIVKADKFYEAEEEHQKYFEKHGKVC